MCNGCVCVSVCGACAQLVRAWAWQKYAQLNLIGLKLQNTRLLIVAQLN